MSIKFKLNDAITKLISDISNDFNFPPLGKKNTKLLEENFLFVQDKNTYEQTKKYFNMFNSVINKINSNNSHSSNNSNKTKLSEEFNTALSQLNNFTKNSSELKTIQKIDIEKPFEFENMQAIRTSRKNQLTNDQFVKYSNFIKSIDHLKMIYDHIQLVLNKKDYCKPFIKSQLLECFYIDFNVSNMSDVLEIELIIADVLNISNYFYLEENYCRIIWDNDPDKSKLEIQRNQFNESIGRLLQITNPNSPLMYLKLLDKNNELECDNYILSACEIDYVTGDRIYPGVNNVITIHSTNITTKIYYPDKTYLINLLKFYIDKVTIENIFISDITNKYQWQKQFFLTIKIREMSYTIPNTSIWKQLKFDEANELEKYIYNKIIQLISINTNNKNSQYQIINCIRIHPHKCNKKIICKKNNKLLKEICDCHMEICVRCHKEYHGYSDCNLPQLEQTQFELDRIANICACPECKSPIIKDSGCNHITCFCNVQFCYACKREFEKDSNGKYKINEHYADNEVGVNFGSKCKQFITNS